MDAMGYLHYPTPIRVADPQHAFHSTSVTVFTRHRRRPARCVTIAAVTPESLTRLVHDFLESSASGAVLEDGAVVFDLARAKYSVSGEHNKCLLHVWSAERNFVRHVVDAELKDGSLRLAVRRLGQSRPARIEICRHRDPRSPSSKRSARLAYQHKLRRALDRHCPDLPVVHMTTGSDLEKSFGPIYARGLMRRARSAFAVLGVNDQESQSSVDAALTFGILWLEECRRTQASKCVVEGLKLVVPWGRSALTRERMAGLNRSAAKWSLHEFHEAHDTLTEMDCSDRGNLRTRLVHSVDQADVRQRFSAAIAQVETAAPNCEVEVLSSAEVAFCCRGLEFARARIATEPGSFRAAEEIVFGIGPEPPRLLNSANQTSFRDLAAHLREIRHPYGPKQHPLWKLAPERWLESLVAADVRALDDRLNPAFVYSQIPAFTASDRAMLDVLTCTRGNRIVVIELKADEDIHLPMQGLDYWARVAWHHQRNEFARFGYFPGVPLSVQEPQLMLVAPSLRIHPATDTLLRYLSPEVEWELLGLGEHWREEIKVVFRKRPAERHISAA